MSPVPPQPDPTSATGATLGQSPCKSRGSAMLLASAMMREIQSNPTYTGGGGVIASRGTGACVGRPLSRGGRLRPDSGSSWSITRTSLLQAILSAVLGGGGRTAPQRGGFTDWRREGTNGPNPAFTSVDVCGRTYLCSRSNVSAHDSLPIRWIRVIPECPFDPKTGRPVLLPSSPLPTRPTFPPTLPWHLFPTPP